MAYPSWSWWKSFIVASLFEMALQRIEPTGAEEEVFQNPDIHALSLEYWRVLCTLGKVWIHGSCHRTCPETRSWKSTYLDYLIEICRGHLDRFCAEAVKTGSGTVRFGISFLTLFSVWTLQDRWRGRDYDRGLSRLQQASSHALVSLMVEVNLCWLKGHSLDHFHPLDHWDHFIYLRITGSVGKIATVVLVVGILLSYNVRHSISSKQDEHNKHYTQEWPIGGYANKYILGQLIQDFTK